jgi:uncharacterized protein YkwD
LTKPRPTNKPDVKQEKKDDKKNTENTDDKKKTEDKKNTDENKKDINEEKKTEKKEDSKITTPVDDFTPAPLLEATVRIPHEFIVSSPDLSKIFEYQNKLRTTPASLITDPSLLSKVTARPPLLWDNGLALAARDHCEDRVSSVEKDIFDPIGSDTSTYFDRIRRYGEAGWYRGENIYVGSGDGQMVVGLEEELNRKNIFSKYFKLTGIYTCAHMGRKLTVIVYADSMKLNDAAEVELKQFRNTDFEGEVEQKKPKSNGQWDDNIDGFG